MNKKLIIQITVIVIALGASGWVIYNGFFGGSGGSASDSTTAPTLAVENLLPYGDKLDFSVLSSRPFVYDQVPLPKLDPNFEVGVPENSLIAPLSP